METVEAVQRGEPMKKLTVEGTMLSGDSRHDPGDRNQEATKKRKNVPSQVTRVQEGF